jgi:D-amino-acid dehydrogenase
MSPDGVPIVGQLFGNVYIATGGGPWGITWGPLMGKSLASLINDDDDPPIRLGPLKPERFDTLIYRQLLKSRAPETNVS